MPHFVFGHFQAKGLINQSELSVHGQCARHTQLDKNSWFKLNGSNAKAHQIGFTVTSEIHGNQFQVRKLIDSSEPNLGHPDN